MKDNSSPRALKIVVILFNKPTSLSHVSHMMLEIIHLRIVNPIKISCSSRVPDLFCSREANEVSNQGRIHRVDQSSLDNGILGLPSLKRWISFRRLGKVSIDISQLIFAKDIHFNNLEPQSIVGAIQLIANWSSQRVIKQWVWWGVGSDQNFRHLAC